MVALYMFEHRQKANPHLISLLNAIHSTATVKPHIGIVRQTMARLRVKACHQKGQSVTFKKQQLCVFIS